MQQHAPPPLSINTHYGENAQYGESLKYNNPAHPSPQFQPYGRPPVNAPPGLLKTPTPVGPQSYGKQHFSPAAERLPPAGWDWAPQGTGIGAPTPFAPVALKKDDGGGFGGGMAMGGMAMAMVSTPDAYMARQCGVADFIDDPFDPCLN
jgi:hypothetical protein